MACLIYGNLQGAPGGVVVWDSSYFHIALYNLLVVLEKGSYVKSLNFSMFL